MLTFLHHNLQYVEIHRCSDYSKKNIESYYTPKKKSFLEIKVEFQVSTLKEWRI